MVPSPSAAHRHSEPWLLINEGFTYTLTANWALFPMSMEPALECKNGDSRGADHPLHLFWWRCELLIGWGSFGLLPGGPVPLLARPYVADFY